MKNSIDNKFCTSYVIAVGFVMLLSGCLATARMKDFPTTASAIDFDKYSATYHQQSSPFWTSETSNEYFIEKEKIYSQRDLVEMIKTALYKRGFTIKKESLENDYIIGKRGLQGNEWSSITGVYYKVDSAKRRTYVYLNTKITQDITGGWRSNRAKKIGEIIEKEMEAK